MQIKLLFRLTAALLPLFAAAQSNDIRRGTALEQLAERLEVNTRQPLLNQSFVRPLSHKQFSQAVDSILADTTQSRRLSTIDRALLERYRSKFDSTAIRISVIRVEPLVRLSYARESNSANDPYHLTGGFNLRGNLAKSFAFNVYAIGTRERIPGYLDHWRLRYPGVPGIGNFSSGNNDNVSYFDLRGSIQTAVSPSIDLQLGYDRMFLGNGHRSLFLSDFSNNAVFFRFNARVWKLNFQSLYLQLQPQTGAVGAKKFLRVNTLGVDVARWLNVSVFDAVVLGRQNGFDLNYLLPLTFLRAMEQQSGSPDNALLGINLKLNLRGGVQLYVQFLLDEFKLSEIKAGSGWWANKFAYQAGVKYFDAFGVPNLDVQLETNRVRPFTYSHYDSVANYSHSKQPLAHPLGANFHELIGMARYKPIQKLQLSGKMVYYRQGLDSAGNNTGNNVLTVYTDRPRNYGWEVGSGDRASCLLLQGTVSWELYPQMLVEIDVISRNFRANLAPDRNSTFVSVGLRWNITSRVFDF